MYPEQRLEREGSVSEKWQTNSRAHQSQLSCDRIYTSVQTRTLWCATILEVEWLESQSAESYSNKEETLDRSQCPDITTAVKCMAIMLELPTKSPFRTELEFCVSGKVIL